MRIFEKVYNIDRLDFEFLNINLINNLTTDEIELINNVFRSTKNDLSTKENIIKLYINMVKNICGDLPIIISYQKGIGKKKIRVYEINKELLFDLLSLTKMKSPYLKNYNTELIKKFTNIEAEIEPPKNCVTLRDYQEAEELEAEDLHNAYLFGKIGKIK